MMEFPAREVYERRAEITRSIDLHFSDTGRWLGIMESNGLGIRQDVREWCVENMSSPYAFSRMSVKAFTLEHTHLHVTSETDAFNFVVRWY